MQIGKERERHLEAPRLVGARGKPTRPNCDGIEHKDVEFKQTISFFPMMLGFFVGALEEGRNTNYTPGELLSLR